MSLPPRWFRREEPPDAERPISAAAHPRGPRVVIVGPCASGKSTLAAGLRALGFDAVPVGQEHSDIPLLWRRSGPEVLVALEVDLGTIRRRRDETDWPEWLFDLQRRRLGAASAAATLRVDAASLTAEEVLAEVTKFLEAAGAAPGPDAGPPGLPGQLGENPSPA
ncbi:MAG: hypothetical protein ACKOWF_19415 [Chloroflexota bacterium]